MKRLIRSPFTWGILAVLVVVTPHIISYQFIATDLIHVGVLDGTLEHPGLGPCSLYQFSDGTPGHNAKLSTLGLWPWFLHPNWKINFCRHLPSALMTLTHQIFGKTTWGYPLHSSLWYLAVIILLGLLAKRVFLLKQTIPNLDKPGEKNNNSSSGNFTLSSITVGLAMVIFAFSSGNAETIYYSAARWLPMVVTFGLAGLLTHIKWREENWKPGRFLSPAFFILSLLCGEASLAMFAYLAAYEFFAAPGSWKERFKAFLPAMIMVVIYLIIYRVGHYGTSFIGLYNNPFHDPAGFIAVLPLKLGGIIGQMFYHLTTFFWFNYLDPANILLTTGAALLSLLFIGLLFFPVWKTIRKKGEEKEKDINSTNNDENIKPTIDLGRRFKWIITGMFLSIIPFCAGFPRGRMALIPSLGSSIILAVILHYWIRKVRFKAEWKKLRLWLALPLCLVIIFLHLLLSPYGWYIEAKGLKDFATSEKKFHEKTVLNDLQPHQKAIFLNLGADPDLLYSAYLYRHVFGLPMGPNWWQLSFSTIGHRYTRTAENTLELEFLGKDKQEFKYFDAYGLYYPGSAIEKGHVTRLDGLTITILDKGENGMPRIRFVFDHPLENESYRFFHFNKENKLENSTLPAVGQILELTKEEAKEKKD